MTDFVTKITEREKREFELAQWHERFLRAQTYRLSCGWDEKSRGGDRDP